MEGVCCNAHPHNCVDQYPLGDEDVAVVIFESLGQCKENLTQRFLLCR